MADAWLASMQDVLTVQDQSKIPELNEYQCGTYLMHSLAEAHEIAQNVLTRKVAVNKKRRADIGRKPVERLIRHDSKGRLKLYMTSFRRPKIFVPIFNLPATVLHRLKNKLADADSVHSIITL